MYNHVSSYSQLLSYSFLLKETSTTNIYTLSLHDALPISELDDAQQAQLMIRLSSTAFDLDQARALLEVAQAQRSEEHTSELQSQSNLVCRLLLEKKNQKFLDIVFTIFRTETASRGSAG